LDCSCPRVNAKSNIFEKAERVQEMYRQEGKAIAVIVHVGRGIQVRMSHDHEWNDMKKALIGDLIDEIDDNIEYGLELPVFVFAFSKMRRGISFRSHKRVPTHFLVALGRGHNCSNVVQTLDRATFNGKSVLEENGFKHVTLLTTGSDYIMALKTQQFVKDVYLRYKEGESFIEAVNGAKNVMPDKANFLRHSTFREVGMLKGQRKRCEEMIQFEKELTELSCDEQAIKDIYWEDADVQRLLRIVIDLSISYEKLMMLDDIQDAYNDTFKMITGRCSITKANLKTILRQFEDNSFIIKVKATANEASFEERGYKVATSEKWLRQFISDDLAMTKEENENEEDLDETLRLDLDDSIANDSASYCNSTTSEETTEDLEFNDFDVCVYICSFTFPCLPPCLSLRIIIFTS
jgi:hypothetical protein